MKRYRDCSLEEKVDRCRNAMLWSVIIDIEFLVLILLLHYG